MNADAEHDSIYGVESAYAWRRLACALTIATIGGVGMWSVVVALPAIQAEFGVDRAAASVPYTFVMLGYFLFCLGLLYLITLDQRYRCRTCLRRLRMPVLRGSWTNVLLGPPRTEYICPYGHGTLKVPELQIGGPYPPDWQAHEDIWKELFSTEATKR